MTGIMICNEDIDDNVQINSKTKKGIPKYPMLEQTQLHNLKEIKLHQKNK